MSNTLQALYSTLKLMNKQKQLIRSFSISLRRGLRQPKVIGLRSYC